MHRLARVVPVVAVLVMACAKEPPPPPPAPPGPPAAVRVTASEYAFQMPDTVTAGPTTFTLVNSGVELHHLQLVRLEEGKTVEDFAALPPQGPPPAWMIMVGGPNPVVGGREVAATVDLAPGNYVAICFIPSPPPGDLKPHVAKGMIRPFTVVPASDTRAMPAAHFTITLKDFDYDFSAPLPAGEHDIKVVNAGPQEHEVVIMKLTPGKKPQDMVDWFFAGSKEPPPADPVGGTAGLSVNKEIFIHVNLTPGEYALYCFLEDVKDKKMHTEHGMMKQFTVQ